MYNDLENIVSYVSISHGYARQRFRDFYGPFWMGSASFWRRNGLEGLDPETKRIDNQWIIDSFYKCRSLKTLNKQAAIFTLYVQIWSVKKYLKTRRIRWEEEVYDYLQKRTFAQNPKYMFNANGTLKKSFSKDPFTAIHNVTTRRIKQCLYDLYRTKNEGSLGTPRPEERARIQKMNTSFVDVNDAFDILETFLRARGNPWDALR